MVKDREPVSQRNIFQEHHKKLHEKYKETILVNYHAFVIQISFYHNLISTSIVTYTRKNVKKTNEVSKPFRFDYLLENVIR